MNPQNMINQNLALSISAKKDKPIGSLRGKLSISQFRNEQNAKTTWEDIEGKWEGEETDEEINEALRRLS
jgi:hypothetical protein